MGLATIDPHSHKVQTKLYKIPKFERKFPPVERVEQPELSREEKARLHRGTQVEGGRGVGE